MAEFKQQTLLLSESLPDFTAAIKAADRKNSGDWEIVRWEDIHPHLLMPKQERVVEHLEEGEETFTARFTSRTQALRASSAWVRTSVKGYSESGHWGVWRWNDGGHTIYQTALPVHRPVAGTTTIGSRSTSNQLDSELVSVRGRTLREARKIMLEDQVSLEDVVARAMREYQRVRFFEKMDRAYLKLQSDHEAWAEELSERRQTEGTLTDDLEPDEFVAPVTSGEEQRVAGG